MKLGPKNLNLEHLKHSSLMFSASIVGGLFNFLLQIVANNFLTEKDFSFMYSLFTLSMIFGVLGISVLTMVAKEISSYGAKGDKARVSYVFVHTLIKMLTIVGFSFIIFLPFAGKIASILSRPDAVTAVIVTGFLMCLSVVVPIGYGALQGLERFTKWSLSMILFSFMRLSIGITLIYLGFNVTGAVSASVIAYIIIFLIILYWLRDIVLLKDKKEADESLIEYYKTSWWITIAFFFNYIICFVDILIVQHYFHGDNAAIYSSASLLGRAIFYLPWALAASMFPKVSKLLAEGKPSVGLLKSTLKYSLSLCLAAAIGLYFLADFIVGWLLKSSYTLEVPSLLKVFVFALIPYALTTILIYYNIAAHRIKVLWVLLAASILHLFLLNNFRNSLLEIVNMLAVSGVIICGALLIFTLYEEGKAGRI